MLHRFVQNFKFDTVHAFVMPLFHSSPFPRDIQFSANLSNRHNRMSMKGGLCISHPAKQASWPHGSPLAAASSEGSGSRQQQHTGSGFDRLRCPSTAVDTEQCRHSLLCHLSRMRDQALPRASLCRCSTGGKAALCGLSADSLCI